MWPPPSITPAIGRRSPLLAEPGAGLSARTAPALPDGPLAAVGCDAPSWLRTELILAPSSSAAARAGPGQLRPFQVRTPLRSTRSADSTSDASCTRAGEVPCCAQVRSIASAT